MCYSAQVVQLVHKINRQLGIRLGFEANFEGPVTEQGLRIKSVIDEHRNHTAGKFEKDILSPEDSARERRTLAADQGLVA